VAARVIRAFALGAAVINLGYAGASAVLVLYAQELLGLGEVGYGLLLAEAAAGAVTGSMLAAPIVRRLGRSMAVLVAVAVLAVSIAAAGAISVPVMCAVALAAFGLASEVWNVVAVSYRQAAVPDHLLGRVMAGYRFIAYGAHPVARRSAASSPDASGCGHPSWWRGW
jgi:MFS family permease